MPTLVTLLPCPTPAQGIWRRRERMRGTLMVAVAHVRLIATADALGGLRRLLGWRSRARCCIWLWGRWRRDGRHIADGLSPDVPSKGPLRVRWREHGDKAWLVRAVTGLLQTEERGHTYLNHDVPPCSGSLPPINVSDGKEANCNLVIKDTAVTVDSLDLLAQLRGYSHSRCEAQDQNGYLRLALRGWYQVTLLDLRQSRFKVFRMWKSQHPL